jgi:alkanesulfonate monooxygenase SsuD/methylene tetrahydromethanopterin reductase-like flavin-dependent oxidoreductase (luciferase family)
MTAVDVDALDAARALATPGEWDHHCCIVGADSGPVTQTFLARDGDLIVAAVNALPELLAEVRRGRALRVRIERSVEAAEVSLAHGLPVDVAEYVAGLRAALDPT